VRLSKVSAVRKPTLVFVCLLLGGLRAASALSYLTIDDADLADQAPVIAQIAVLSESPAAGTALPSTEYVVLVERVLKGSLDATAVIRVLGGEREDGMTFIVPGAPVFHDSEKALVFLAPRSDGTFSVLHFTLGAFHRMDTDATEALAVRDLGQAFALDRRAGSTGGPRA
jgi:hypothetical protein